MCKFREFFTNQNFKMKDYWQNVKNASSYLCAKYLKYKWSVKYVRVYGNANRKKICNICIS